MALHKPTHEELDQLARGMGLHLRPEQVDTYLDLMAPMLEGYRLLDAEPEELPHVAYPRTPGHPPPASANPYNAWYYRCHIEGAGSGPLQGKTFAIKDSICVAGVPMMNGSATLQGLVPEVDATVVTRILDAGGTIAGKSHCELYCVSGGSHTNSTGPVINPRRAGYSAGGSSSGSAALVAAGDVDMAIGGDQAGSVRNPAAFCGVVGMKATHGLVPYSGATPLEPTVDHLGPITRTVADNALLLQVLAGADGMDPRQADVHVGDYVAALEGGAKGLRIGVVKEGFGLPMSQPDVDATVQSAAKRFEKLGAVVEAVSIPVHRTLAPAAWSAICLEGPAANTFHGGILGFNGPGLYPPSLLLAYDAADQHIDDTSDPHKVQILFGRYMVARHHGKYYAKAQNLVRRITAAYDTMLAKYDLLLMPTSPVKATPLPGPDANIAEICQRGSEMLWNTCQFNITGHPALTLPCGESDGLPVGLMLIGKHWDEATIYRAAHALEQAL